MAKQKNKITAAAPRNSRPLGSFEKEYLAWHLKLAYRPFKWIMGLLSCFTVLLGLGFPVMIMTRDFLRPEGILVALVGCVVLVTLGAFLTKVTCQRKLILAETASSISGVLTCQTTRVVMPSTGGSSMVKRYKIGEMLLCYPIGCEELLTPYIDQQIEVIAATYATSNPIAIFGGRSIFDEPRSTALLLEFSDTINVQRAMENHGARLFKTRLYQTILASLLGIGLMAWALFYVIDHVAPEDEFIMIGVTIFSFAFTLGILYFIYIKIETWLGIVPYLEKVKG